MKRNKETRLDNLNKIIEEEAQYGERGAKARVADKANTPPSYLSQVLSGKRGLGDEVAEKVEKAYGKPDGWLDEPHNKVVQIREYEDSQDEILFAEAVEVVDNALSLHYDDDHSVWKAENRGRIYFNAFLIAKAHDAPTTRERIPPDELRKLIKAVA